MLRISDLQPNNSSYWRAWEEQTYYEFLICNQITLLIEEPEKSKHATKFRYVIITLFIEELEKSKHVTIFWFDIHLLVHIVACIHETILSNWTLDSDSNFLIPIYFATWFWLFIIAEFIFWKIKCLQRYIPKISSYVYDTCILA